MRSVLGAVLAPGTVGCHSCQRLSCWHPNISRSSTRPSGVSSVAVTTTKPGNAKPVAADHVLTDSTRVCAIDGALTSTPIARVTANQADHGRTFNVTLANGTAAKLAKHTAAVGDHSSWRQSGTADGSAVARRGAEAGRRHDQSVEGLNGPGGVMLSAMRLSSATAACNQVAANTSHRRSPPPD